MDQDHELESLRARVAALESERLPKVDRASRRRDRRQVLGGIGLFALAIVMGGIVSASALAGSNTVFSDDVVDGEIKHADVKANSLGSSRFLDNSVTGGKITDGTIKRQDLSPASVSSSILDLHTNGNGFDPPSGSEFTYKAECINGAMALSGGGEIDLSSGANIDMQSSGPVTDGVTGEQAWQVTWRVDGGSVDPEFAQIFVICLSQDD